MSPLPILAVALAIVITGVLALRLHAFLTLIIAALAVAALTPGAAIERYELTRDGVSIERVGADGRDVFVMTREGRLARGAAHEVYRLGSGGQRPRRVGVVEVVGPVAAAPAQPGAASTGQPGGVDEQGAGPGGHRDNESRPAPGTRTSRPVRGTTPIGEVALAVRSVDRDATLAAGDWVTTAATARAASRLSADTIGRRVAEGFGRTALDIGILIAMASILGGCLMAARGAERIVISLRTALGAARTPLAFLGSGFLLGIPMFAEAVFYLLLPLAKAMWHETRRNYVLFVLAIVAGATMTHSLVPPTPGPLFVADAMGIEIALMMQQGLIVAAIAAAAGYTYARHADRRWGFPLRAAAGHHDAAGAGGGASTDPRTLPPLVLSLLPILLPVILISAESAIGPYQGTLPEWLIWVVRVFGDKNLALTVSAGTAMALLAWYGTGDTRHGSPAEAVRKTVRDSVVEAGEIILIIAAGGALGATLRQAGMAELAAATVPDQKLLLLPIAWGITALVRVAQGSATVAMITSVGIIGPIALAVDLPYHPVYVAVAIGSGSKPGMWMNDSGFWVVSRMSGMTETEMLKTTSAMLLIEGCVGLVATVILAVVWPMV